jgi:hypothetical protein
MEKGYKKRPKVCVMGTVVLTYHGRRKKSYSEKEGEDVVFGPLYNSEDDSLILPRHLSQRDIYLWDILLWVLLLWDILL